VNRFSTTLATAFALLLVAPISTYAGDNFTDRLPEADWAVRDVAPTYGCYDSTDSRSCQLVRWAPGPGGNFSTRDFAGGEHHRCFQPGNVRYQVCDNGHGQIWGEILDPTNRIWNRGPPADARCIGFGSPVSVEYLTCEAAMPPPPQG
jgi:hypothetical protein